MFYFFFIENKYTSLNINIYTLFFYIFLSIMLGGKLGFIIFYTDNFIKYEDIITFDFWTKGRSFYGGLILSSFTLYIFTYIYKIKYLLLTDLILKYLPIGIFFGRIGNFITGELYGINTHLFCGVIFANGGPYSRHPTQLYESILEGPILYLLLNKTSKKHKKNGCITAVFLSTYGIFRLMIEHLKEQIFIYEIIPIDQMLSLITIILGVLIYKYIKN